MPSSVPSASSPTRRQNEWLFKGLLCALIGLGVLLAPYFITSPGMQGIVGQSSAVGWFALVLGLALVLRHGLARRAARQAPTHTTPPAKKGR